MELNLKGLEELGSVENLRLPAFAVATMQAEGRENPRWIHVGPGNLFRAYVARVADDLIARGEHWPIVAVAPRDPGDMDVQLGDHDLMSLKVTLNPDGTREERVVAGISEALAVAREADYRRLVEVARNPGVALMSFTITEKGYVITDSAGDLQPEVTSGLAEAPGSQEAAAAHAMLLTAGLLWERFNAVRDSGKPAPLTLLSFDNFSHNGDKLRESVLTIVSKWLEQGAVPREFADWVGDEGNVAFPITVIDKITPRPSPAVAADLAARGFTDMEVTTPRRTPLAGFVNTEPTEYLIIEDKFAGERPAWEGLGVDVVARETCDDFEIMKVTTCLNPLHTALAVAGCLLHFPTIDSEMRDPALAALVRELGEREAMPVVVDPGIVKPEEFLQEVLEVRFPNRYLPDDPARIAMDTSQKLPIRFGVTLKKYRERGLDLGALHAIPFVFALWLRYLTGLDDNGAPLEISSDPLGPELQAHFQGVALGENDDAEARLAPLLAREDIFGIDLTETPLAAKVTDFYKEMMSAPGAIRATVDKEFHK